MPAPAFAPFIIESAFGHTLMSTDYNEAHECHESCLVCGAMYVLRDRDGDGRTGVLEAANGDPADPCTRETSMVHGYPNERWCDTCKTDDCAHTRHRCHCLFCDS